MKVIGIQRVDYINKHGYHVLGYKLYTSTPADRKDCVGNITEVIFVSDQIFGSCENLQLDDEILVSYNKFGKVIAITVI